MGFNFEEFFDQASDKVQDSLNDLVKVGKPAIEASLEQWGIDVLTKAQKESQGELNAAVKEITAKDPAPGSFGAAVSATVKGTVLETYGLYIVLGVVSLVAIGFLARGK